MPLLFQGEEWGASSPFQYFTAHEDERLGSQVSEGRRNEFAAFGWDPSRVPDPQSLDTFERSRLRWDELASPEHAEVLGWYRALIHLRGQRPELRDGRFRQVEVNVNEESRLSIRRGAVVVACNLGESSAMFDVESRHSVLLASHPGVHCSSGAIYLPPESIAVLEKLEGDIA